MEKYKICPSCKTKNAPALFECINCEADLTGVKVVDEVTEKMIAEDVTAQAVTMPWKMVRVCDCGETNPANARKCKACGEDISDITPTPDNNEEEVEISSFVLSSLDGQFAYKIASDDITIGRENTMSEYLSVKSYVSRAHARVTRENNELYIENLSSTNFTYVNNKKITEKAKLRDGDEIGLGGTNLNGKRQEQAAYFLVRIGQCM